MQAVDELQLAVTSTAGNATITNNGGASQQCGRGRDAILEHLDCRQRDDHQQRRRSQRRGRGQTEFFERLDCRQRDDHQQRRRSQQCGQGRDRYSSNTSTAGNATITNNGSAVSGGNGGFTEFLNTSTAGNATITTDGGTGGGFGGLTAFFDSSDGGTARAITNGNGSFDISGLTTAGMGIGSIEGSGNYFLGSKTLSVGGNNLSTTVSGVIQDGGVAGGTLGSLTKVGTGTLTLTGNNIYMGGTTIRAGTLQLGNGGTTGSIVGDVTDNGNLAFDRSNVLTFGGVISGTGSVQQNGTGTTVLVRDNTYTGTTTVNAGSLIVDGSIASPQTLVNAGAFLGGHGSIGGNFVNSGTVAREILQEH